MAQKECGETIYWLELLFASKYISQEEFSSIHPEAEELMKMLRSSILTLKQKNNNITKDS